VSEWFGMARGFPSSSRGEVDLKLRRILSCLRIGGCKSWEIAVDFLASWIAVEDGVKRLDRRVLVLWIGLMFLTGDVALAQQPPAQQQPANVAGNWTLYCKDPNGSTSTKYLELQQEGGTIKGHFKGPNQSGGVEGTIDVQHLVVRTKTRDVLTFRGRANGPREGGVIRADSYNGTFHDRGGTGSFQGVRTN
jgi:hypothetical protein